MVRFLIQRPIAVIMAFLGLVIIGVITWFVLPVSLLPSIDIPTIVVRIENPDLSAREIENVATATLRRQLQQVGGLADISSTSHDGFATIELTFDYGVDTDMAFVEVNEKIDAAMNYLPRDLRRPRVVKASATDIPVVYLQLTSRSGDDSEEAFLALAEAADNTVRRSLEQLPEVAMTDVTGLPSQIIRITPLRHITDPLGLTDADISKALAANNINPGSLTVREGYYEYHVAIANQLRTIDDVRDIYIRHAGRILRLGDVAEVMPVSARQRGESVYNGHRAVTLAIIKQDDENIDRMQQAIDRTVSRMEEMFPDIQFVQTRNQTELLDYTISNLVQNLVLGLVLVFLLTALFMHDGRTPFVIGLSVVVALILTFLIFYLARISINVVSLSGLILAVGMMIDNSVIVTENIMQWRTRGESLDEACDRGTSEMITPLLSSMLTTVAVFVPLIFMSGIAGAIFTDQAYAITAGLIASYAVGILLLPVLYRVFFAGSKAPRPLGDSRADRWMSRIYTRVIDAVFAYKWPVLIVTALLLPTCAVMFSVMPAEKMPAVTHTETLVRVSWPGNVTIEENRRLTDSLGAVAAPLACEVAAFVGTQDFLVDHGTELRPTEAEIYVRAADDAVLNAVIARMTDALARTHPDAAIQFGPPENIFERIFSSPLPDLEARLSARGGGSADYNSYLSVCRAVTDAAGPASGTVPVERRTDIVPDAERMTLYGVSQSDVITTLRNAFSDNTVTTLRSFSHYMPVTIGSTDSPTLEQTLRDVMVTSAPDREGHRSSYPLADMVTLRESHDFSYIPADKSGEYLPLAYDAPADPERLTHQIRHAVDRDGSWDVAFTGALFANRRMMQEMVWILAVALVLTYFILCAQFESFVQPLIVLLEIPLDTTVALLTLWAFGYSLNVMSAIGIIVTCGIVVNDSILKLDAINRFRADGMPLIEAIHTAGVRRLRPIIMTSLTTILAMVPILFTDDIGSEIQRPLAVAMIGSMIIGTLISIFIIPLVYYVIYNRKTQSE